MQRKSFLICASQLLGSALLKILKYVGVMLNILKG